MFDFCWTDWGWWVKGCPGVRIATDNPELLGWFLGFCFIVILFAFLIHEKSR